MKKRSELAPADRLIVAADFNPKDVPLGERITWVENQVMGLAMSLEGTGVYLKVNSALRAVGYRLAQRIHDCGLRVFADLKLVDISETLAIDGEFLLAIQPELLTVMCGAHTKGMSALKAILPDTEVIAVTVLTNFTDVDSCETHHRSVPTAVRDFTVLACRAKMDGVVSSAAEAMMIRGIIGQDMTINSANIRPAWAVVAGDDQNKNRSRTPAEARALTVDRIVVGRPISKAKSPREAVLRTLDEIAA